MKPVVSRISYFPVKGLAGADLAKVTLDPAVGIPLDRAFALLHRAAGAEPAAREFPWAAKPSFAVQHDWPALARLRCEFDSAQGVLRIEDPDRGEGARGKVQADSDRAALARFVGEFLAGTRPSAPSRHPKLQELQLVGGPEARTRYPDRSKVHLSILNLETLRDLERQMGVALDIRSFRGNIVVDGVPAWSELEWEKRTLEIGAARILIPAPLLRCHNINVDPVSGDDGLRTLEFLKEKLGHSKFGMAGTVVAGGEIALGDPVRIQA